MNRDGKMADRKPAGRARPDPHRPEERLTPIRVAVRSQTPLEQGALEALVGSLPGLEAVGAGATPPPDVLLWDPTPGAREGFPTGDNTAVLILTEEAENLSPPPGAAGLFSRDEAPASLGVAIRQVARGQQYLSPSLALAILRQQEEPSDKGDIDLERLTEREREVLSFLAEGLSNKEIAAHLYLSVRTVEGHLSNAYGKLGVDSRTEAALLSARLL